jgi:hypothetical protein
MKNPAASRSVKSEALPNPKPLAETENSAGVLAKRNAPPGVLTTKS